MSIPKLSEATRLGAMMCEQIYSNPQSFKGDEVCGACAIGSALLANGIKVRGSEGFGENVFTRSAAIWPILAMPVPCPSCTEGISYGIGGGTLFNTIYYHLGFQHKWTREQIASWVETIENQLAVPVEAPCESALNVSR